MAQVWYPPADTEAQPEDTPAVTATGIGTLYVLGEKVPMPKRP